MKIVLFGYSYHPYTLDILEALNDSHVNIHALIEAKPKYTMNKVSNSSDIDNEFLSKVNLKNLVSFWSIKTFALNPIKGIKYLQNIYLAKKEKKSSKNPLDGLNIYKVNDHTGKDCEQLLKKINPDLIILGPSSSIIRSNILSIPKIGIINAHMGLLPQFRGMNALEWTLFHLDRASVTIHFVDEGLDTGDIIRTYEFPFEGRSSVSSLRVLGRKKMAWGLAKAARCIETGEYSRKKQKIEEGKQYFSMHQKLIDIVDLNLSGDISS